MPVEVPPRMPIVPVGAIARTPTGQEIALNLENSAAVLSDCASYTFNHLCSSGVVSYFSPR